MSAAFIQHRSIWPRTRSSWLRIVTGRIGCLSRSSTNTGLDKTPVPHFSPHWRRAIIVGSKSSPFSVRRYSTLRRSSGHGVRCNIPLSVKRVRRLANMLRAMLNSDRNSSKCRTPLKAARNIMKDQRSPIASNAMGRPHSASSCNGSRNSPIKHPLNRRLRPLFQIINPNYKFKLQLETYNNK